MVFLTPSEGGGDVFFHISEVLGDYEILINDEVRYVVRTDRKNGKPEAVLIDVLGDSTEAKDGEPKPEPKPLATSATTMVEEPKPTVGEEA